MRDNTKFFHNLFVTSSLKKLFISLHYLQLQQNDLNLISSRTAWERGVHFGAA